MLINGWEERNVSYKFFEHPLCAQMLRYIYIMYYESIHVRYHLEYLRHIYHMNTMPNIITFKSPIPIIYMNFRSQNDFKTNMISRDSIIFIVKIIVIKNHTHTHYVIYNYLTCVK